MALPRRRHWRQDHATPRQLLLIIMVGYWYISLNSIYGQWAAARASRKVEDLAGALPAVAESPNPRQ